MFECAVETTYTDPMKVHDEFPKHAEAAKAKLGECYMTGTTNTSTPDYDAGVPTGSHVYRLTTLWKAGTKPE
jgi:hypothetical protein